MGIFGAVTGIIGGIQGASAASDAAAEKVKGLVQSADTVDKRVNEVNPAIAEAYRNAGLQVLDASNGAAGGVLGAAQAAAAGVNGASTQANALLQPYISTGSTAATSLAEMFAPGGSGTRSFTAADMEASDPGYQFRLDKAKQAIERSASSRGTVLGGGTLRELNKEIQGIASSEYGNAFQRFQQEQQQRFSQLTTLANGGLAASGTAGANLTRAAQVSGDYGVTGEKVAGDYRTSGATYNGNLATRSIESTSQNALQAAAFRANAEQGIGDAKAQEHLGRANAWNSALNAAGGGLDGFVSGGFDGGGKFNLKDAFRGYSR